VRFADIVVPALHVRSRPPLHTGLSTAVVPSPTAGIVPPISARPRSYPRDRTRISLRALLACCRPTSLRTVQYWPAAVELHHGCGLRNPSAAPIATRLACVAAVCSERDGDAFWRFLAMPLLAMPHIPIRSTGRIP
jgi:hypothetical protein